MDLMTWLYYFWPEVFLTSGIIGIVVLWLKMENELPNYTGVK